jgi:hypothetical protein
MAAKSEGLTKRQLRTIARVQALKTVPLIIILLSLFFYQAEWFNSLQKIQVSYDFSNYQNPGVSKIATDVIPTQIPTPGIGSLSFTQNNSFSQYIEELVNFIDQGENTTTANLTEAEQNVIDSQPHFFGVFGSLNESEFNTLSTIGQIEYLLHQTITEAQQIYSAFLNGTLQKQFLHQFLRDVWRNVIDKSLPQGWKKPSYIFIENQGALTIRDLTTTGKFRVNQTELNFLQYNTTHLAQSEKATLTLTLSQIIIAFLEITFDALVMKSIEILETKNITALESFPEYFRVILLSIHINVQLLITVRLGLLPTILDFRVDLTNLYQTRIQEEFPQ